MKLRSKLILAFLLMSVVPLTAIVLYSYSTSIETLRHAALTEVLGLTAEIGDRIETIRDDVGRGVRQLGTAEFHYLLSDSVPSADGERFLAQIGTALGPAAPFVESLEFVPSPPEPAAAPAVESIVIRLGELSSRLEQAPEDTQAWLESDEGQELLAEVRVSSEVVGRELAERALELDLKGLVEEAEILALEARQLAHERESGAEERELRRVLMVEPMQVEGAKLEWKPNLLEEEQLAQMEARQLEAKRILGREFDSSVEQQGREVGKLRAQISAKKVLEQVLRQSRREEGEIPFAVDAEGNVYVAREEDRATLSGLPLVSESPEYGDSGREDLDDWVIVRLEDAESGLVYGIARPIGRSLADLRRTAGRNLAFGLGLIGLALVGIAPLSRRITRDLHGLTESAGKLAEGDLETRVPVRSRDEVGHLARTFNQMAADLQQHQRRLIEQERLSKEQEIQHRLLEAENARKGEELEAARSFQLSLLPKRLPQHRELEIDVFMRTATEVGGDYYDFHLTPDGALTAAVGDATGHGARAGTMVTVIKSLFTADGADSGLAEFLTQASRSIRRMELGRMAMALTLIRYRSGAITLAAAGMPPALVYRSASGAVEEVAVEGIPLGAMSDVRYREHRIDLAPGDTVLLMSDGFPELINQHGEPLGYAEVRRLFQRAAGRSPSGIIGELSKAAESWSGGSTPSDDITFLALQVNP